MRKTVWAVIVVCTLVYPWLDQTQGWGNMSSLVEVWIYVLIALGLNVVVGFGGLLNLGYAAFFSVGAFTMAHLTSAQSPLRQSMPAIGFWPGLLGACLVAMASGALVALPTLRLRGDYLAIVTMGFGCMLPPLLQHYTEITLATTGLAGIPSPTVGSWTIESDIGWYFLVIGIVVVTLGLLYRLKHSRYGRALRAMREDELAAASCGLNLIGVKMLAFLLGAVVAGLGGALYASRLGTLTLGFPQDFSGSIMFLAMCILGGLGSLQGSVVGALMLGLINKVLTPLLSASFPFLEHAQFLLFGLTLVLMMRLRPQGLIPDSDRS